MVIVAGYVTRTSVSNTQGAALISAVEVMIWVRSPTAAAAPNTSPITGIALVTAYWMIISVTRIAARSNIS